VTPPVLSQIDLVCADVSRTVAFYRVLGLKFPKSAIWTTKTGPHHVRIQMGSMEMALDSIPLAKAYNKSFRRLPGGGNVVIGFSVATRRAVDAAYAKLVRAGHKGLQPPFDAFWGARYAIVADPDGNHVGLMSPVDAKKRSAGPSL
jgi:uncharacterized glyoxalase superfamily protein PhnB